MFFQGVIGFFFPSGADQHLAQVVMSGGMIRIKLDHFLELADRIVPMTESLVRATELKCDEVDIRISPNGLARREVLGRLQGLDRIFEAAETQIGASDNVDGGGFILAMVAHGSITARQSGRKGESWAHLNFCAGRKGSRDAAAVISRVCCESGDKSRALQTLARGTEGPELREAFGVRAIYR